MVSTTSAFSPVKNYNSHMKEMAVGQMNPATFTALDGVHRHPADTILMQDDNFRATKNVFPENKLPVHTVAGIHGEKIFGFEPYEVPSVDHKWHTSGFSGNKFVEKCFTDTKAKAFQWVPPAKYVAHDDWNKTKFPDKRGKFGKYKKETFTEDVFKYEKGRTGPHHYSTYDQYRKAKPHGNYNQYVKLFQ